MASRNHRQLPALSARTNSPFILPRELGDPWSLLREHAIAILGQVEVNLEQVRSDEALDRVRTGALDLAVIWRALGDDDAPGRGFLPAASAARSSAG
jgi:hypothetical protein